MKYLNTEITFQEFPDEITLCINITNCPFKCSGCHSPELWEDIGTKLTIAELDELIKSNKGITCIGFMGGSLNDINPLAEYIKNINPLIKVGWYTGGIIKEDELFKLEFFDYVKSGPYVKELGGLDCPSTNQKFYNIKHLENKTEWLDWTYKFWNK